MSREIAFAVPGDLATPTGGYAYDRRIISELKELGWRLSPIDIGAGFPRPTPSAREAALRALAILPAESLLVIDGLAFGVMADEARRLREKHRLVALVHHPLALETGLLQADAEAFRCSERSALATASAVIVTSPSTARLLAADYGIERSDITVAPPGVDPTEPARGSHDGIVRLLAVGSIVPRKGYDVLVGALAGLGDWPWHLIIAGPHDRDPAAVARLQADILRFGLTERITLAGALPEAQLATLYAGADLFVLASRFEGYGMAYAEAIAHGLPVIGTTAGATPETVPAEAAILVPPDDPVALTAALRLLIADAGERASRAAAARSAARTLPTWRESAKIFSEALEALR